MLPTPDFPHHPSPLDIYIYQLRVAESAAMAAAQTVAMRAAVAQAASAAALSVGAMNPGRDSQLPSGASHMSSTIQQRNAAAVNPFTPPLPSNIPSAAMASTSAQHSLPHSCTTARATAVSCPKACAQACPQAYRHACPQACPNPCSKACPQTCPIARSRGPTPFSSPSQSYTMPTLCSDANQFAWELSPAPSATIRTPQLICFDSPPPETLSNQQESLLAISHCNLPSTPTLSPANPRASLTHAPSQSSLASEVPEAFLNSLHSNAFFGGAPLDDPLLNEPLEPEKCSPPCQSPHSGMTPPHSGLPPAAQAMTPAPYASSQHLWCRENRAVAFTPISQSTFEGHMSSPSTHNSAASWSAASAADDTSSPVPFGPLCSPTCVPHAYAQSIVLGSMPASTAVFAVAPYTPAAPYAPRPATPTPPAPPVPIVPPAPPALPTSREPPSVTPGAGASTSSTPSTMLVATPTEENLIDRKMVQDGLSSQRASHSLVFPAADLAAGAPGATQKES